MLGSHPPEASHPRPHTLSADSGPGSWVGKAWSCHSSEIEVKIPILPTRVTKYAVEPTVTLEPTIHPLIDLQVTLEPTCVRFGIFRTRKVRHDSL